MLKQQKKKKIVYVLEWPNQRPDLKLIENLWQDLKIAVLCSSNLGELVKSCTEDWEKMPKSKYVKLVRHIQDNFKSCNCCTKTMNSIDFGGGHYKENTD